MRRTCSSVPPLLYTGGVPSHVSVPTPGSIHEGAELVYVLVHAFGRSRTIPICLSGRGW
jgi:phosphoketolase